MQKLSQLTILAISLSTAWAEVIDFSNINRDASSKPVVIDLPGSGTLDSSQIYNTHKLVEPYGSWQGAIAVSGSTITLGQEDEYTRSYTYEQVAIPIPPSYFPSGSPGYPITAATVISFELKEEGTDPVENNRKFTSFAVVGPAQLASLTQGGLGRIIIGDYSGTFEPPTNFNLLPAAYEDGDTVRVLKEPTATVGWVRYTIYVQNSHAAIPSANTPDNYFTAFKLGHWGLKFGGPAPTPTRTFFRNFRIYEEGAEGPVLEIPQLKVFEDAFVDGDVFVAGAIRSPKDEPLTLAGTVILEKPQGDIKTGIYGEAASE